MAVNLALLPTVGVVGAAIATVATEAFVLVLATIAVWTGMARGARAAPDPPA